MPTYTENVRAGRSIIVCDDCGAQVTRELQHEAEHQARDLARRAAEQEATVQTGVRPYVRGTACVDTPVLHLVPGDEVLTSPALAVDMSAVLLTRRRTGALIRRVERVQLTRDELGVVHFTDGSHTIEGRMRGLCLRVAS